MKKIIFVLAFLGYYSASFAQRALKELTSTDYEKTLRNLEFFQSYNLKDHLVKVYQYENGSGSAQNPGSDEVNYSILILRFPYGEHEEPQKFIIQKLSNPKIISVTTTAIEVLEKTSQKKLVYTWPKPLRKLKGK